MKEKKKIKNLMWMIMIMTIIKNRWTTYKLTHQWHMRRIHLSWSQINLKIKGEVAKDNNLKIVHKTVREISHKIKMD
jgi:hypothetical protein